MEKIRVVGLTLLVVGLLVAGVVLWAAGSEEGAPETALNLGGDPVPTGRAVASAGISGIIEYTVRDADGKLKDHGIIHNTVNGDALNETFNRIAATATGGAFDGIAALSVATSTDNPSDGVLSTSIELLLDGDGGTGGDQNPADGTVTTDFGTETGNGTVAVTFTATGSADVLQIVLTKAAEDDTLVGGADAIADADIFAYVDVPDISLTSSDTVTYTWTVDVDP